MYIPAFVISVMSVFVLAAVFSGKLTTFHCPSILPLLFEPQPVATSATAAKRARASVRVTGNMRAHLSGWVSTTPAECERADAAKVLYRIGQVSTSTEGINRAVPSPVRAR